MAEKVAKIDAKLESVIYLLNDEEVKSEMGEAFSSVMINPTVTWAKFVLTDDRTNANGERIPKSEFVNLMKSGIHMPVKMAMGEISAGHPGTKPLGTITHLKETQTQDGVSAIVALAALWGEERPADVQFIRQRFAENLPVDVSWEILYEDASLNTETNSMDLFGTVLRAATIVGNPAYQGRTPFLSIAATKKSDATVETETIVEEDLMDTKELEAKVAELEPKLNEATSEIESLKASLSEKEAEIVRLTEENTAKETELVPLREYKASIETEVAKTDKLNSIKEKFAEAKIETTDTYFDEKSEMLLKMDDETLAFFIQELSANLAEASKTSSASKKDKKEIPNLQNTEDTEDYTDPKTLGRILRTQGKK